MTHSQLSVLISAIFGAAMLIIIGSAVGCFIIAVVWAIVSLIQMEN